MSGEPPKTEYNQAEAYGPMEQAVQDTVEVLPDFPGFVGRGWHELPCSHNGKDDSDYTNIEIRYSFGRELSDDPMIREEYIDVLRNHWEEQGYTVRTDEGDDSGFYNLSVTREDGISLWYKVWGIVSLVVQSGCVPVSDESEIEYIPPAGGIEPGSESDGVGDYFPEGIPTNGSPTEEAGAIAPLDGDEAAAPSGSAPWLRELEG